MTKTDVLEAEEMPRTKKKELEEAFFLEEVMQIEEQASDKVVAEKVPQAHAETKNEFRNARVRPPRREMTQKECEDMENERGRWSHQFMAEAEM